MDNVGSSNIPEVQQTAHTVRLPFEIDPAIIHHIIHSQAGSIGKSLLELVMNAIDAQATAVTLNVTRAGFSCSDDGVGFQSRLDIVRYFGKFGTPHMDGDATFGRFRLGRGQIMAHASTVWTSRSWAMVVDTKAHGHTYELTEAPPTGHDAGGCTINGTWYEPLTESELQSTLQEIRDLVRYTPARVDLNGRTISRDPAREQWDKIDDVAYYRAKPEGAVSIYNQGVLVRHDSGHTWGAGGVMVSKLPISLNVSRTEILRKTCPTWRHMAKAFTPLAEALSGRMGHRRTEERRQRTAQSLLEGSENIWHLALNEQVITVLPGKRHLTFMDFVRRLRWKDAGPSDSTERGNVAVVERPEDVPKGEAIARMDLLPILHPVTLQRFHCETTEDLREEFRRIYEHLLNAQASFDRRDRYTLTPLEFVDFGTLRDHFVVRTRVLEDRKALDKDTRRAWTALRWCLFHYAGTCLGVPTCSSGRVRYEDSAKVPQILIGDSNLADAWTDGKTYVAFDKRQVEHLKARPMAAAAKLFSLLEHELAHNGDSLAEGHDDVFYQRHHDMTLAMVETREKFMTRFLRKYTQSMLDEGKPRRDSSEAWREQKLREMANDQRIRRNLPTTFGDGLEDSLDESVPEPSAVFIEKVNENLHRSAPDDVDWTQVIREAAGVQKRIHEAYEPAAAPDRSSTEQRWCAVLGLSRETFVALGGLGSLPLAVAAEMNDDEIIFWWESATSDFDDELLGHDDLAPCEWDPDEEALARAEPAPNDLRWLPPTHHDLVRQGETYASLHRNAAAAGFLYVAEYLTWRAALDDSERCTLSSESLIELRSNTVSLGSNATPREQTNSMDRGKAIARRPLLRPFYTAKERLRATLTCFRFRTDVEREIRTLCDVLRLHDGVVVHHHHGRPWHNWPSLSPPRVSFEAPAHVVQALQTYLDHCVRTNTLHYFWTLRGNWLDGAIRWHLALEDGRLSGLLPWAWSCNKARDDVSTLSGWAYASLRVTHSGSATTSTSPSSLGREHK